MKHFSLNKTDLLISRYEELQKLIFRTEERLKIIDMYKKSAKSIISEEDEKKTSIEKYLTTFNRLFRNREYCEHLELLEEVEKQIAKQRHDLQSYSDEKLNTKIDLEDYYIEINRISLLLGPNFEHSLDYLKYHIKKSIVISKKDDIEEIDDVIIYPMDNFIDMTFDKNTFSPSNVATVSYSNELYDNYPIRNFSLNSLKGYSNEKYIVIENLNDLVVNRSNLSENSIILINAELFDEYDLVKFNNYHVIRFHGPADIIVQKILLLLGYYPQNINENKWTNDENNLILTKYKRNKNN